MALRLVVAVALFASGAQTWATQESLDQWARSQAAHLHEQWTNPSAPRQATNQTPPPRAHPTLDYTLLIRAWPFLDEATRQAVEGVIRLHPTAQGFTLNYPLAQASEADPVLTVSTSHFVITHYRQGRETDALALATAATVLEEVYEELVQSPRGLRFPSPLPQDGLFPVVIRDLPDGFYGVTYPRRCEAQRCESRIEIDDDFAFLYAPGDTLAQKEQKLLNASRVTLAHEFFHAIQFAHYKILFTKNEQTVRLDNWAVEGAAVWAEDAVYPTINDYVSAYLPTFFAHSAVPWPTPTPQENTLHHYGAVMYFKGLVEGPDAPFGPLGVRRFFEDWAGGEYDTAMEAFFTPDLAAQVAHQTWLKTLTGAFADSPVYPPVTPFKIIRQFPHTEAMRIDPFATYLFQLDLTALAQPSTISFTGQKNFWTVAAQTTQGHWLLNPSDLFPGRYTQAWLLFTPHPVNGQSLGINIAATPQATNPTTVFLPLARGWNLVSAPVSPPQTSPAAHFPQADALLAPVNRGIGVEFLQPEDEDFPQLTRPGQVYFLHVSQFDPNPAGLTGESTLPNPFHITLHPGYNPLGNPFTTSVKVKERLTCEHGGAWLPLSSLPPGLLGENLWVLGIDTQTYDPAPDFTLAPGQAGWLTTRQKLACRWR